MNNNSGAAPDKDAKSFKLITPETATDDVLRELGMTRAEFDAKMVQFTVGKAASWLLEKGSHPLFYMKFPVKTPCVVRSSDWFETHERAIIAAADADLELYHKSGTSFDASYPYFNAQARTLLFYQMAKAYIALAASGNLLMQVSNGCCIQTKTCYFSQYQRCLLKAMRRDYDADA